MSKTDLASTFEAFLKPESSSMHFNSIVKFYETPAPTTPVLPVEIISKIFSYVPRKDLFDLLILNSDYHAEISKYVHATLDLQRFLEADQAGNITNKYDTLLKSALQRIKINQDLACPDIPASLLSFPRLKEIEILGGPQTVTVLTIREDQVESTTDMSQHCATRSRLVRKFDDDGLWRLALVSYITTISMHPIPVLAPGWAAEGLFSQFVMPELKYLSCPVRAFPDDFASANMSKRQTAIDKAESEVYTKWPKDSRGVPEHIYIETMDFLGKHPDMVRCETTPAYEILFRISLPKLRELHLPISFDDVERQDLPDVGWSRIPNLRTVTLVLREQLQLRQISKVVNWMEKRFPPDCQVRIHSSWGRTRPLLLRIPHGAPAQRTRELINQIASQASERIGWARIERRWLKHANGWIEADVEVHG